LPQGIVEAFNVIGFPGLLCDSFVSRRWNHTCISIVLICMEYGLLTVDQGDFGLQLFGTVTTPITHVKRDHLAGLSVHGFCQLVDRPPEPMT
jgi:hypothetical protein